MLRSLSLLAIVAFAGPAVAQAAPTPTPPPAAAPATSSAAPAAPEPQRTTATYGDWVLQCVRPDKGTTSCELVQTLFNQGNPFARTIFGRLGKSEPLRLIIAVPVNVTLGVAPRMQGAENESGFPASDLTWRRCVGQICLAEMPISDDQLKRLRTRTENARISFQDAAGKEAVLPFGPHGLSQGLDALMKEESAK